MRLLSKHTMRRTIGAGVILASATGLSGCVVPEGVNLADVYEDWAGFCGILQDCGSDTDSNRGGQQTETGSSSSNSSSTSTSTGQSTPEPDGE